MSDQADRPSIAEIAALTARLQALSNAGRDADQAEVDRFLADKRDLLDRIDADLDESSVADAQQTEDAVQRVHGAITNRSPAVEAPIEPTAVEEPTAQDEAGFW